jgi:hypothetical protein
VGSPPETSLDRSRIAFPEPPAPSCLGLIMIGKSSLFEELYCHTLKN